MVDPLKLVIDNYPDGLVEEMTAINNPELRDAEGNTITENNTHTIHFSKELFIERDDFMEDGGKKFMRLGPGKEVRLKNGYIIACSDERTSRATISALRRMSRVTLPVCMPRMTPRARAVCRVRTVKSRARRCTG